MTAGRRRLVAALVVAYLVYRLLEEEAELEHERTRLRFMGVLDAICTPELER